MKTQPNDPITPCIVDSDSGDGFTSETKHDGLTKREYYAGLAMQSMLVGDFRPFEKRDITDTAVKYADSLIESLNII